MGPLDRFFGPTARTKALINRFSFDLVTFETVTTYRNDLKTSTTTRKRCGFRRSGPLALVAVAHDR